MKKACICGNFGNENNTSGGQIIKTLIVYNALKSQIENEKILTVNTYKWIHRPLRLLLNCIKSSKSCDNIIIMPAHKGVKVFIPLYLGLKKFFNFKLHYIVIGGWITEFAKNKKFLKKLKKIDYIYCETTTMKKELEMLGCNNIVILPNFKKIKIIDEVKIYDKKTIDICIFSRITEKKGITHAIDAVKNFNSRYTPKYKLDIYGPIDKKYEKEFFNKIKDNNYIEYKGIIDFNYTSNVLKDYCFLLFPTLYETEGIPGTIIDAYASGIPVLASKWNNFDDIIIENKTGLSYEFGSFKDLCFKLKVISNDISIINNMKANCIKEAKKYMENNIEILIKRLM